MPHYPSLHDVATSPIISAKLLYHLRILSFVAHLFVIILGIYTRFPVFFVQFTNWTNMLSMVYSVLALLSSFYFARPNFYHDASLTKVFIRSKPSKIAYLTQLLLQLTLPLHAIVTGVFWPLVFPEADISHGNFDYVYFILSHGTTFFILIMETLFNKIQFDRRILKFHLLYIIIYGTLAFILLVKFEYPVYGFIDYRGNKTNKIIIACIPFVIVLFNELAILLGFLRNKAVKVALNIDIPKIQKKYKRYSRQEKSFDNGSEGQ